MISSPIFRRIVLGFQPGAIDRGSLEFSAELAGLLGAALEGVFVEDDFLKEWTRSAQIREFQLRSLQWSATPAGSLAEEMQLAARCARRALETIALRRGVKSLFDVLGRKSLDAFLTATHPNDILVVTAPGGPPEFLTPPAFGVDILEKISSPLMLLPRRIVSRKGPVVAVLSSTGNSTLRVAAALARAAGERLLLLFPDNGRDREDLLDSALAAGMARGDIELRMLPAIDTENLLAALAACRGRFIVLPRPDESKPRRVETGQIISRRLAPLMLVDPSAALEP